MADGGCGGGFLLWRVGDSLQLNGMLLLDGGDDHREQNGGGGSGGGLDLYVTDMLGHGVISIKGGDGTSGGSGLFIVYSIVNILLYIRYVLYTGFLR